MNSRYIHNNISRIPLRAAIAIIARCARRVQPLLSLLADHDLLCIEEAIKIPEYYANCKSIDKSNACHVSEAAFEIGSRFNDALCSAAKTAAASAAAVCFMEENIGMELQTMYGIVISPMYFAVEACNEIVPYAQSDLSRLLLMDLGEPGLPGLAVDPTELGPLGLLWPDGEPNWSSFFRNTDD